MFRDTSHLAELPHSDGHKNAAAAPHPQSKEFEAKVKFYAERFKHARKALGEKIVDQDTVIAHCIITLLAGGHSMLNGVPGLAKTKLVNNLASVFNLNAKRQQFTSDLMPQNLKGYFVADEIGGRTEMRFIEGPLFAQLFMADEINRANGRVQSGLLEAMAEKEISVNGVVNKLPRPFHVLATLNPLDQEGTFPLTEANKDRFMMEIKVHRPSAEAEQRIMLGVGRDNTLVRDYFTAQDLLEMQAMVDVMPVSESVAAAILKLIRSTIPNAKIEPGELDLAKRRPDSASVPALVKAFVQSPEDEGDGGAGIRASMALTQCVKARAMMDGRLAPSLDDVLALAEPVLRHRLTMTHSAHAIRMTPVKLIGRLTEFLKPQ